jgi:hypothetical protein
MEKIVSLLYVYAAGGCLVFAGCSGAPDSSATGGPTARTTERLTSAPTAKPMSSLLPAYAVAWPGADCTLHPDGNNDKNESLDVIADDDGIVRFYGTRLSRDNPAARQILECKDEQGKSGTYVVDLSTAGPFQEILVPGDRAALRPPLAGSPSDYSTLQLIQMGYGLRPDANKNPSDYARWLGAATKAAKPVTRSHGARKLRNGQTGTIASTTWTGPIFTPQLYVATYAEMNVPEVIPGGDNIPGGAGSLWGGMGGTPLFGSDPSILQDGVEWTATRTTVSFNAWIEYWPLNDSPQFNVSAGDHIVAEAWACDSNGNVNISGGWGCFFIEDTTTGDLRSCTQPTGTPCSSIAAPSTFRGVTAEFILEKKTQFMPDHWQAVVLPGDALDTSGNWETFGAFDYTLSTITGVHGGLIDFAGVGSNYVSFSFNPREGGQ